MTCVPLKYNHMPKIDKLPNDLYYKSIISGELYRVRVSEKHT